MQVVSVTLSYINIIYDTVGCDRPILRDLVNHVVPFVSNQWYELGLQLLDPDYAHELDTIEAADMKNDIKICCRKMFSKWMKTDELASWDKVIEALTLIGLNDVARNIKQLLQQGKNRFYEYVYLGSEWEAGNLFGVALCYKRADFMPNTEWSEELQNSDWELEA